MITTYDELLAAIQKWLTQDDVSEEAPTFVQLFESEINDELRVQEMKATDAGTFSGDTVPVPEGYIETMVWYSTAVVETPLEYRPPVQFHASVARNTNGMQPLIYTREGDVFLVAPTPTDTLDYVHEFYQKVPRLSAANPSNWMLAAYPNLYLYGSLLQAEEFVMNDPRADRWMARYKKAKRRLQGRDARSKYRPGGRMRAHTGYGYDSGRGRYR